MKKFAVALLALCLLALPAQSAVDRTLIPAGAQWLVHVDVQAAFGSQLFKALQENRPVPDFQEMQERLGIDPTRDIQAVTVYGLSHDPEAVVVMLHTHSVIDNVITSLSSHARRKSVEVDGLHFSRWSDPDGSGETLYSYVARLTDGNKRIVLVSRDANELIAGIEVVRGESESLSDSGSKLGANTNADAIVHVSASGKLLEWAADQSSRNIARLVRTAVVEVGERGSSAYIHASVDTASSDDASRVIQILEGAMTLAGLASETKPGVAAMMSLLEGLEFNTDGSTLTIHFEQNAADLVALLHGSPQRDAVEEQAASQKTRARPKPDNDSDSRRR